MAVLARHSLVRPVGKQRSCWLRLRKPGEEERNGPRSGWVAEGAPGVQAWGEDECGAGGGSKFESPCSDPIGALGEDGVCMAVGGEIWGWGSPLSSMGLWDRVRACSTQLPFSPNTPASFWTKSLRGRGGRTCLSQNPWDPSSSTCLLEAEPQGPLGSARELQCPGILLRQSPAAGAQAWGWDQPTPIRSAGRKEREQSW